MQNEKVETQIRKVGTRRNWRKPEYGYWQVVWVSKIDGSRGRYARHSDLFKKLFIVNFGNELFVVVGEFVCTTQTKTIPTSK